MARYNAIQIGSIYLTNTGLVGGTPCKTSVSGLEALKPQYNKNIIKAIDGTPYSQLAVGQKGFDLEISISWLAKSVFDDINDLLDDADDTQTPVAVVIDGDFGTFNVNVVPNVSYVSYGKFSNDVLQDVKYRVVTT